MCCKQSTQKRVEKPDKLSVSSLSWYMSDLSIINFMSNMKSDSLVLF